MIKTLLCDLGNVLVFFCHERMCRQIGEVCGRPAEDVHLHLLRSDLQYQFERGQIDEIQLHAQLEKIFDTRISLPDLVLACGDIFELNVPMVPVLHNFKQQGIRLVLLSNTCISHINFVRARWDFLDLFDHLILSYQVGAVKPEDAIFNVALQHVHARPEETLYIDDIAAYIEKGRSFGLQGEVFTTTAQFVKTLPRYGIKILGCVDN